MVTHFLESYLQLIEHMYRTAFYNHCLHCKHALNLLFQYVMAALYLTSQKSSKNAWLNRKTV